MVDFILLLIVLVYVGCTAILWIRSIERQRQTVGRSLKIWEIVLLLVLCSIWPIVTLGIIVYGIFGGRLSGLGD